MSLPLSTKAASYLCSCVQTRHLCSSHVVFSHHILILIIQKRIVSTESFLSIFVIACFTWCFGIHDLGAKSSASLIIKGSDLVSPWGPVRPEVIIRTARTGEGVGFE